MLVTLQSPRLYSRLIVFCFITDILAVHCCLYIVLYRLNLRYYFDHILCFFITLNKTSTIIMSTLNQSPINHEEFISLAERVTSKLQSLEDSPNPTSSEAKVKQVTQNTIKLCHELLVQADDVLKLQLGSLNGVPEQITSRHSVVLSKTATGNILLLLTDHSGIIYNQYSRSSCTLVSTPSM